jgi:hypothetical protein
MQDFPRNHNVATLLDSKDLTPLHKRNHSDDFFKNSWTVGFRLNYPIFHQFLIVTL